MNSRLLTIDIQQDQISAALLGHGLKGTQIVKTGRIRIVPQTNGEDSLEAVKSALEKLAATMGDVHDRCAVSIPSHHFFFRTITLPFKQKKKISQILSFELENYLPCSVEEVKSDFCLLEKNSKSLSAKNMTGVASIKNAVLEEFKTIFNACGIYPDVVTTGSGYAEALLYAQDTKLPGLSFFIHSRPGVAAIYAVLSGEIVFCRSLQLNSDIRVQPVKKMVIQTLLSVNELFDASFDLSRIIISGTSSFQERLAAEFEKEPDVRVEAFDVFKTIQLRPASDAATPDPYDSADAIALGVSDIKGLEIYNFTRQVSDLALFYQENKFNLGVLLILSFFLFFAWAIDPITRVNKLENRIEQLDNSIVQVFKSSFPNVKTIVDPVHQMQVKVDALKDKKKIAYFDEYPLCIDLLNEISRALPSSLDIIFSRFVRTENNLLISGSADQFNTIDQMKNHFKKIALFNEVDINSASMDKVDKRVRFNLKILL